MTSLFDKIKNWANQNSGPSAKKHKPSDDVIKSSSEEPTTSEDTSPQFFELFNEPGPLFITGQAGTGKSTLVRKMVTALKSKKSKVAVVAPTGIAALNSKGETIHSLFKFPPRFIDYKDLPSGQPDILSVLDHLIIDEISMVRADMMDCIHASFCRAKKITDYVNAPFCGGVKIIFVGDLYQLPPVVIGELKKVFAKSGEWKSPWFFDAHCLADKQIPCIELTKVYRLTDDDSRDSFLSSLGKIRVGDVDNKVLNYLHTESSQELETPIYLTGTRLKAENINLQELEKIDAYAKDYVGRIEGDVEYKEQDFPSPMQLTLKVGAQVIFTKNVPEKGIVNGMMGVIEEMSKNVIAVNVRQESGASELVTIKEVGWSQYKHVYDKENGKIEFKEIGAFYQFPLKLGWAVTVHKSQGLTLAAAAISIDRAFACGQIYVALSRVRKIKDLCFSKPLKAVDVQCDERVTQFFDSRVDFKYKMEE